jgi:hypothetical protein
MIVVGRAHPWPTDRYAPATQRHRAVLMAVTLGDAIGVVLALRSDDLVDLEIHQLVHDAEPNTHAEREQALPRGADELPERFLNLRWERTLGRLQARDDLRCGYVLHGGSSCPLGLGSRPERSHRERTGREDRRSKFYETSDNLLMKTRVAMDWMMAFVAVRLAATRPSESDTRTGRVGRRRAFPAATPQPPEAPAHVQALPSSIRSPTLPCWDFVVNQDAYCSFGGAAARRSR